ncbi:MAG TPA: hypothetical protein ENI87_07840 [bacterium]|nr:hypothetical protein [bacterium]
MNPTRFCVATALCALAVSTPLAAQAGVFATSVVSSNTNGNAGGGIFQPSNALGAPLGSTDVHSLGIGGDLVLGFSVPIVDGPGADLIVAENPFRLTSDPLATFAEVLFVEVSSDGVHFARFPSRYFGPPVQPGAFGTVPVGTYAGLAGQTPVLANQPGADPQDVVEAGGDAFDLADLAGDPLVRSGLVDLQAITQVRLVDVVSGLSTDSGGTPIFDPGAGSADVDAVTAIHQQGTVSANGPSVAITITAQGLIKLRIEDPDGWADLDPSSLRAAISGIPVAAGGLFGALTMVQADSLGFTLVQTQPLPPSLLFTLSVSLKDRAGHRSGLTRVRPTS